MSAVRASATARGSGPASDGAPGEVGRSRPVLRLVQQPLRSAPRLPFVILVGALLSLGLAGLLLLSLQRNQAAFAQGRLATTDAGLADQVQALQRQVEADQDPTVLASRAAALGMVPGSMAGYLGPNGAVLGAVPSGAPVPMGGAAGTDGVVVAGRSALPTGPTGATPGPSSTASAKASVKTRAATKTTPRTASTPGPGSSKANPTPTPTRTGTR